MELSLALSLPRDELSVPVVRQICSQAMRVLGVADVCLQDLQVALTEACANVLKHAQADQEYEVRVRIDDEMFAVDIVDRGAGFDLSSKGHDTADVDAEQGRGIMLMRQLVDRVAFTIRPDSGNVLTMEKALTYADGSPLKRMTESGAAAS